MAWIYLPELAESHKHLPHGSQQSPIVSVSDTHKVFCCPECQKVKLIPHQFGTMSPPSNRNCCQGLTSLVEDSPVKTSVLQDMEKDWAEAEADYFSKLSDLQENLGQGSFFSKMSPPSGQEVSTLSSKNSPKSALIVDGQCFQLQKLVPSTSVKDGFFWQTPTVQDKSRTHHNQRNGTIKLSLLGQARLWATPNAHDSAMGPMSLETAMTGKHQLTLVTQVKHPQLWPTPKTNMTDCPAERKRKSPDLAAMVAMNSPQTSGQLNPEWVEWLMGYRTGVTELSAWAMEWFRSK